MGGKQDGRRASSLLNYSPAPSIFRFYPSMQRSDTLLEMLLNPSRH